MLRRALEQDRFGLVARVLDVRDGCTAEACDFFRLLENPRVIAANLTARAYDALVARHAPSWPAAAGRDAPPSTIQLIWTVGVPDDWRSRIQDAVGAARQADAAIVVAGIEEGEGFDRAHVGLPGHQEELISAVASSGKPVTVVLVGGSAVTMTAWKDKVSAILNVRYPGDQGGSAVADVLFGDYNPSGRLPLSFTLFEGQLPFVYNHKPTGRNDNYGDLTGQPLFPFGFGLSYTTFQYDGLCLP